MRRIDHKAEVLETISSFFLNPFLSDIDLIVEGKLFPGHKFILAARSHFFRALLFGGLKESRERRVELKETPLEAFTLLLGYIYKGELELDRLNDKEVILDLFTLANRYGFDDLLKSMSEEATTLLSVRNILVFYEAAVDYQLNDLVERCLQFLDQNAVLFLKHSSFTRICGHSLKSLLKRSTFCAPETLIYTAVEKWFVENAECQESDKKAILETIRLPLIDEEDLILRAKSSALFSWPQVTEAIKAKEDPEYVRKLSRYGCLINENVFRRDMHIRLPSEPPRGGEVARHPLRQGSQGILLEFHKPYLINKMRIKVFASLVDPISSPFPAYDSYFVETSWNGSVWDRVIDRRQGENCLLFWSEKAFYFRPQVVQYIRIRGAVDQVHLDRERSYLFKLKEFEALYVEDEFDFAEDGVLLPKFNAASVPLKRLTAKEDYFISNCDLKEKYKFPRIQKIDGTSFIEFTLEQLSEINCIKLLLWDQDSRVSYGYIIQVSSDDRTWETVVDKSGTQCQAWQEHLFPKRRIFFVKIRGTHVFNCPDLCDTFKLVHFECRFREGPARGPGPGPGAVGGQSGH